MYCVDCKFVQIQRTPFVCVLRFTQWLSAEEGKSRHVIWSEKWKTGDSLVCYVVH